MAETSKIEWTDSTWNPIGGCTRVSEGCRNCYAEIMAARFSGPGQWGEGLAHMVGKDHRWTGKMVLHEAALDRPLRWRKPRRIFVNSTSDIFHESVPDEWIDCVFAVMALAPQHTFQVLTKRPERMRAYLSQPGRTGDVLDAALALYRHHGATAFRVVEDGIQLLTLPNVWLGTSIEDQATADARIPHLLATPAAVRFLSAEPLLGPVSLRWLDAWSENAPATALKPGGVTDHLDGLRCLDWVIVGGESGPHARPMHPDWARSLRDQCNAAGVPLFFKQWGEWEPSLDRDRDDPDWRANYTTNYVDRGKSRWLNLEGGQGFHGDRFHVMRRVGKTHAGRLMDGREWNEMPGRIMPKRIQLRRAKGGGCPSMEDKPPLATS